MGLTAEMPFAFREFSMNCPNHQNLPFCCGLPIGCEGPGSRVRAVSESLERSYPCDYRRRNIPQSRYRSGRRHIRPIRGVNFGECG
jgi:hypothetical protein